MPREVHGFRDNEAGAVVAHFDVKSTVNHFQGDHDARCVRMLLNIR
jgi:hypothetical protein